MANEITVSANLAFSKNGTRVSFGKTGLQFDVSGDDYLHQTQVIGTSEEALALGDVTPGMILIFNTDTTNYVSVRSGTGAANLIKIPAGEFCLFRLEASAPYLIANTASVRIEYLLIEN